MSKRRKRACALVPRPDALHQYGKVLDDSGPGFPRPREAKCFAPSNARGQRARLCFCCLQVCCEETVSYMCGCIRGRCIYTNPHAHTNTCLGGGPSHDLGVELLPCHHVLIYQLGHRPVRTRIKPSITEREGGREGGSQGKKEREREIRGRREGELGKPRTPLTLPRNCGVGQARKRACLGTHLINGGRTCAPAPGGRGGSRKEGRGEEGLRGVLWTCGQLCVGRHARTRTHMHEQVVLHPTGYSLQAKPADGGKAPPDEQRKQEAQAAD